MRVLTRIKHQDDMAKEWSEAVEAECKALIEAAVLAEREACAKLLESRKTGANELMDAVRDMEDRSIRARVQA